MSSLTPDSGSTLSTPWPRLQHVDELVAVAQHDLGAADDDVGRGDVRRDVLAQVGEHLAHRLQADAGVEQRLDDAQLEQVAVRVARAGCRCPSPRRATAG